MTIMGGDIPSVFVLPTIEVERWSDGNYRRKVWDREAFMRGEGFVEGYVVVSPILMARHQREALLILKYGGL